MRQQKGARLQTKDRREPAALVDVLLEEELGRDGIADVKSARR